MKQIGRKYHKNLAALVIILVLSGAVITCHLTGLLNFVEYKFYDLRINFFADSSRRSDDIVLVLLDQESLEWGRRERGWGWPWPREAYAELIEYMTLGEVKSIAFDMLYSEPSVYRNSRQDEIIDGAMKNLQSAQTAFLEGQQQAGGALFRELVENLTELGEREDDASFAEAAGRFGKVVQTVFFSTQTGSATRWPEDLKTPLFNTDSFGPALSRFELSAEEENAGAQFPIQELTETAAVIGNVTGRPDPEDDIVRRVRLFTVFDGKAVPGLAAASLLASGHDNNLSYDPAKKLIRWGEYTVPVDDEGKTLLRFRGDIITRYPRYPIFEILQSAEDYAAGKEPTLPPENFKDSYVFFGLYAPGLWDIFSTPVNSAYPGLGVHVTMLDNMLMGDFIRGAPGWIAVLMISCAVVLMVILVLYAGRIGVTIAGLLFSIAVVIIAGFWTFNAGWWIPIAAPLVAVFLAYLTATLYSYATEGKDKRFIKGAFSRILSPKVIDEIIADPSQLKLGGEKRKMTAIFTDIQSFSSVSAELQDEYGEDGPKVLVNLLNLYLTELSDIILANGGTVDKYEGDAIIAFFGAPVWMENHAAQACRSAVQMKKREKEIVGKIMDPDGEFCAPLSKVIARGAIRKERPVYTRLGINSGDMVVGFMGTPAKMDYTIMGNAVNLAARLEGVNKQYDTKGILISEYTRDQIGDEFVVRPLSRVTVVGIPAPVRIYELLEIRSDASPELCEMEKVWEAAFKDYENRDFGKAKQVFADIYQKDPEDTTARLYRARCEKYEASPPPENWGAVDNLTEK